MDCCLLSGEEVGQLDNYGIEPNHENHVHVPVEQAMRGIQDETYRLVRGKHGRNYITLEKTYFLKRTPSGGRGGIHIIQRVISNHITELKPLKF
jgi:hypothetical protein